jgi:hypothetical protein
MLGGATRTKAEERRDADSWLHAYLLVAKEIIAKATSTSPITDRTEWSSSAG